MGGEVEFATDRIWAAQRAGATHEILRSSRARTANWTSQTLEAREGLLADLANYGHADAVAWVAAALLDPNRHELDAVPRQLAAEC